MPYVFDFDHAHEQPPRSLARLLGGKGANLAEMASVLHLRVPPGFTISAEACAQALDGSWPDGLAEEVDAAVDRLAATFGRRLGDPSDPMLVSVRSGAAVSMPGMMDTVLNLGLNDTSVRGLAAATGERFALDSYRRFLAMYAAIVLGLDPAPFSALVDETRERAGAATDADIPVEQLRGLVERFLAMVEDGSGAPFPQDPVDQLRGAVDAVFRSWMGERAIAYRRKEGIPDDLGTAVNVQAMVFGNRDERSGTGVGFTRDPATGEQGAYGDFLVNAQGEDVVAGIRNTQPLAALGDDFPERYRELLDIFARLEHHYRDMCDVEFTIEQDVLWLLQVRIGKRTGAAALRMAVDMVSDPAIALTRAEALGRVTAEHLDQVLHPQLQRRDEPVLTTGLGASPGAAVGRVCLSSEEAAAAAGRGEKVILVRVETSPEDVNGMMVADGVLTARGGLVSHAAVVARGWGKPAVVGAEELIIDEHGFRVGDAEVRAGEVISIDGATGEVVLGAVALVAAQPPAALATVLGWADEVRAGRLGVRANADTGPDAEAARTYGAEGIGLCRTEHMFLAEDRLPIMRAMILAEGPEEEAATLEQLRAAQQDDFLHILEAMDGLPVTVRLLDPPLHEFLPPRHELEVKEATDGLTDDEQRLLDAVRAWSEVNPMIGTRGVRLAVVKPGLYAMQVRALLGAVGTRVAAGGRPLVEVMIPLTVTAPELALARSWVEEELAASGLEDEGGARVLIGTMVETPRAALRAAELAAHADFFSFGTNDLTQLTFGFSRDDVEGRLMTAYLELGLLPANPFQTLDVDGVGELVRRAVVAAREAQPDIKLGVCGEHGGDPASIAAFLDAGLDYVSCSPFRVPIARLAAAHAVLAAAAATEG